MPGLSVGLWYAGDTVWHERLLLAEVSPGTWVCRTPDGDQYVEQIDAGDPEGASRVAVCLPDGTAPRVLRGAFYRFGDGWDDTSLRRMVAAAQDQSRMAGGTAGAPSFVINAAGEKVAFGAWFRPGAAGGEVAPFQLADGDGIDELDAGEGFVWLSLESGSGGLQKGQEVALVRGDTRLGDRAIHVQSDGSMICVSRATLAQAVDQPPDEQPEISDLRVMSPLARNSLGKRWQTFAQGVERLSEERLEDWPLEGERCVSWLCGYIAQHGSTPDGRHTKWANEQGIACDAIGYVLHDIVGFILELAVCYDQLDLANCASFEVLGRLYQLLEETGGSMVVEGLDHYLGRAKTGGRKRGIALAPGLARSVTTALGTEMEILKQRRKAREEEASAKEATKRGKQHQGGGAS